MKYRDVKTFILGVMRGIYVALTTLGYLITYCKIGSWLGVFIEACILPTGLCHMFFCWWLTFYRGLSSVWH
ncbi:MAG: hypothetical protein K2P17_03665 [Helicobacteraceae bacterium]|nr:hypothetical protein [Helicobacteraceae bacterium]